MEWVTPPDDGSGGFYPGGTLVRERCSRCSKRKAVERSPGWRERGFESAHAWLVDFVQKFAEAERDQDENRKRRCCGK
jgi:hypothetical protein